MMVPMVESRTSILCILRPSMISLRQACSSWVQSRIYRKVRPQGEQRLPVSKSTLWLCQRYQYYDALIISINSFQFTLFNLTQLVLLKHQTITAGKLFLQVGHSSLTSVHF